MIKSAIENSSMNVTAIANSISEVARILLMLTDYQIPITKYRILISEYSIPHTAYYIPIIKYRLLNTKCPIPKYTIYDTLYIMPHLID